MNERNRFIRKIKITVTAYVTYSVNIGDISMEKILIAPVGLYIWRVLKGIKKYRPDIVFLLLAKEDEKRPEWFKKTEENTTLLKEQLGYTYEGRIKSIYVNFGDFKDVFRKIHELIENTMSKPYARDETQFFVDITSTPLLPKIALISVAAIHSNVIVYYTPPSEKQPSQYPLELVEKDVGQEPVTIPIVRSKTYEELKRRKMHKDILVALKKSRGKKVSSLAKLLNLLNLDTSKKNYMLLGRILSSLEALGLITMAYSEKREREVALTVLGESLAESLVNVQAA